MKKTFLAFGTPYHYENNMQRTELESVFAYFKKRNVPLRYPEYIPPFDDGGLSEDALLGIEEKYGGFYANTRSYLQFREIFRSCFDIANPPKSALIKINDAAYRATLLFGTIGRFLGYYKRFGQVFKKEKFKKPLDFLNEIVFPDADTFKDINFDAWFNVFNTLGPSPIAKQAFALYSPYFDPPTKDNGKISFKEMVITITSLIENSEIPSFDDPNIQALSKYSHKFGLKGSELTRAAKYHFQACKIGTDDRLPAIKIDGHIFNMQGAVFKKLDRTDPRIPFMGHFTNCCEKVTNKVGCLESSVMETMTDAEYKDTAFYVVEDENGTIIAHSWAWLSKDNILVFDGFESASKSSFSKYNLEKLILALIETAQLGDYDGMNIKGFGLGHCAQHLNMDDLIFHIGPEDYHIALSIKPKHLEDVGMTYQHVMEVCQIEPNQG